VVTNRSRLPIWVTHRHWGVPGGRLLALPNARRGASAIRVRSLASSGAGRDWPFGIQGREHRAEPASPHWKVEFEDPDRQAVATALGASTSCLHGIGNTCGYERTSRCSPHQNASTTWWSSAGVQSEWLSPNAPVPTDSAS